MDSECGGAGPAAVTDPSPAPGADADADQEPVAAHCPELRNAKETQAVVEAGCGATAQAGAGELDHTAKGRVTGDAGGTGNQDRSFGCGSRTGCSRASRCSVIADASGGGTGDRAGHGVDLGRSEAV